MISLPIELDFTHTDVDLKIFLNENIIRQISIDKKYKTICCEKYLLPKKNKLVFDFLFLNNEANFQIHKIVINKQKILSPNWIYLPQNKEYLESIDEVTKKEMKLYTQLHSGNFVWPGKVIVEFSCYNNSSTSYLTPRKEIGSFMIQKESKIYYD